MDIVDNGSTSDSEYGGAKSLWLLLLLVPFVATLWPPFYNSLTPEWQGIPFFYWYLFLWIILSSIITGVVYFFNR